jgi:hypothetical protein
MESRPEPVDLSADYHGHTVDFACDLDRRFFRDHPGITRYVRAAIDHELCANAPDGPCWSIEGHVIEVTAVTEHLRIRRPVPI